MRTTRFISVFVSVVLSFSLYPVAASAQVATALLRASDPLIGAPPGHTITAINNTAVGQGYDYAVTVNSTDGSTTLSHVWGDETGGNGSLIRTETTIGNYQQDSFESFFGISTAPFEAAYSPSCTDTVSGTEGLDGVWFGDTVVMIEEQPYPNDPLYYWSFGSRPTATADGIPCWVGGITDTQGGSTQNRGLFFGYDATPLVIGGGFIGGLPDPVQTGSPGVSFDYRISALGTHYIAEVGTETGSTLNDNSMAISGSVILLEGLPVTEGSPVPEEIGGLPGENWDNFDKTGITEEMQWMFTGDTDALAAFDEIVVLNGEIVHREGDMLDGHLLTGAIEGAYLNDDGDYAFIWDVQEDVDREALFLNGELLLKEGDLVDWDGDGSPDSSATLDVFTGISTLTLGNRDAEAVVQVYFTADVEVIAVAAPLAELEAVGPSQSRDELGIDSETQPEEGPSTQDRRVIREGFFVMDVFLGSSAAPEAGVAVGASRLLATPNPITQGDAEIRLRLDREQPIRLDLFDSNGRRIRELASGLHRSGEQHMGWDGRDGRGRMVPSGVYLLRLRLEDAVYSQSIRVIR